MVPIVRSIAACTLMTVAVSGLVESAARAQGGLTVDPSGAVPAPEPAPAPAPPEPVIIQVPVQGMPGGQAQPASGDDGYYYRDDVDGDWERDGSMQDARGAFYGPVPPYHVVRRGDTLWDICWFYFNNPWEWPKVWAYNPSITNPHWIYPGDLVRLYPQGLSGTESVSAQGPAGGEDAGDDVDVVQVTPARRYGVNLRQHAFVDKDGLDGAYTIVGSVEERTLLSAGDAIYISYADGKPPKVGQTFTVYTETTPVKHPSNGKSVGSYVKILGQLRVQSVKQGKLARAVITESVDVIERGARVGPLQRTLRTVEPRRNDVDLQGTIVALIGNDALIGEGQIIFIDKGEEDKVKVGNRMFVIRRGDAYEETMSPTFKVGQDDGRFPARAIGEIIVVQAGKNVSVAMVSLSLQEIGVGDMVLMRKSRE